MANVTVSVTETALNVSTTLSNITVTDSDGGQTFNVTTIASNIAVTAPVTNVVISETAGVDPGEVRSYISNVSPILYDATSGVISFDSNASFNGKTTDDLAEGSTNLYFTDSRARAAISNTAPILYDSVTGVISIDNAAIDIANSNVTLKEFHETVYDNGNISGAVTFDLHNGTIHKARLTGNVSSITFANVTAGSGITLLLQQDTIGNWVIDTAGLTNWEFAANVKVIDNQPSSNSIIAVLYDGSTYKSSWYKFDDAAAVDLSNNTTSDLAEGTNLYFTAARARGNVSATDAGGLGSFTYSNVTGVFTYTGPSDSDVRTLISATSPITYSNSTGVIGLSSTANITTTGNISGGYFIGNGSLLTGVTSLTNAQVVAYISTQPLTVGGNLQVNGNINATGNINYQNVTDLYVTDQKITLNSNAATNANVEIISNRPTATNTMLKWNEQATRWEFTNDGSTYYPIPASTTDLAEGTNLYYTTARANSAIGAYSGSMNNLVNISASGIINTDTLSAVTGNLELKTTLLNPKTYLRLLSTDVSGFYSEYGFRLVTDVSNAYNQWQFTDSGETYTPGKITAYGDIQGYNFLGNGSQLTGLTTTQVTEGTNLYYSNTRVNAFIQDNITTSDIDEGTNLYWTTDRGNTNSNAWLTTKTTSDLAEGSNLYFTTDRANSAIAAYQGTINTAGNITTSANVEGQYILGNGAFLTGITSGGTVTQIDTGENLTGGPITTTGTIGMANALANVNSVTAETGVNFTVNSTNKTVFTEVINGTTTNTANINGDGYAVYTAGSWQADPRFSYSGAGNLKTVVTYNGVTTAGSNAITGINDIWNFNEDTSLSLSDILTGYLGFNYFVTSGSPFPTGTYVTSVDAGNSIVYMSQNAIASVDFADSLGYYFGSGAYDSSTGQGVLFTSDDDWQVGNAQTINITYATTGSFGYPATGFTPSDFDYYTIGSASDYSLTGDISSFFNGRTQLEAPRTVFNAPRGMIIGEGELTNRAENDPLPSFGLNVMWDGLANTTADYAGQNPITQILLKQYTDNSLTDTQGLYGAGPRLLFTTSQGNKNQTTSQTYPRINTELGRITWWSPSQFFPNLSTIAPPAYISVVTNRDMTGTHNGGVGMYLSASPNTNQGRRGLFIAHQLGDTLIASSNATSTGPSKPITFAPTWTSTSAASTGAGNAVAQFNNTMGATNYQWANINYDNATGKTGSRLSITNGASTVAGRNGNLVLALDRNDNSAGFGDKEWAFKLQPASNDLVLTEDDVVRVTVSGGTVTATAFIGDGSDLTDVRAKTVEEKVINKSGGTLPKGTPVYATGGVTADALWVAACDASNAATMPCIGVLSTELANDAEGRAIVVGTISGVDTSAFTAGDSIYIAVGGGYANVAPAGEANIVQFLGTVTRVDASVGGGVVNIDAPRNEENLNSGNIFIGNGSNVTITKPLTTAITDANVKLKQFAETVVSLGNVSGDISANLDVATGSIFQVTTGGALTINSLTNAVAGTSATIIITQGATTGTLSSTMKFAGGSKTLSTNTGDIDIISVFYDGTTYYATLSKGYA